MLYLPLGVVPAGRRTPETPATQVRAVDALRVAVGGSCSAYQGRQREEKAAAGNHVMVEWHYFLQDGGLMLGLRVAALKLEAESQIIPSDRDDCGVLEFLAVARWYIDSCNWLTGTLLGGTRLYRPDLSKRASFVGTPPVRSGSALEGGQRGASGQWPEGRRRRRRHGSSGLRQRRG